MKFEKLDLQKKKSNVLIVHCSDPRFQVAYRKLIDNLAQYYDLLVFPGASKPIVEDKSVVNNIVMLHGLHHFETIHIFDHVECGAFGAVEDEKQAHRQMMDEAKADLKKVLPEVKVIGHLVGETAEVKL